MIPSFDQNGNLPEGIHDCTVDEAGERFGSFQRAVQRRQLWGSFLEF
jgi:Family of unknown function (DUF6932)